MKNNIYLGLIALGFNALAQTPVGSPNTSIPPSFPNSSFSWFRGGNNIGGSAGFNNIFGFGSGSNSPIYTQTDGQNRTKLNGTISYPIGSTPIDNRSGFMLLTNAPFMPIFGTANTLMSPNYGAHTLLHLVGDEGLFLQDNGYRSWMRNGITLSNNNDAGFIGVRKMPNLAGGTDDVSDFVINWGDNLGQNPAYRSPDNLVFCFTQGNGYGNNDLTGNHPLGRETMRHTADGNVGIGPRFSNTAQPQNYLHINGENFKPTYMQVTNQNATGQTGGDGFLFGVTSTGIAEIIQKENQDFRFYTNNQQQAVINNNGLIGFNALVPNNELEITSRAFTPYGLTGSGLRFTNLKSTNAVTPNGTNGVVNTKVLSVDQNGDVVLVNGAGNTTANSGISVNGGNVQLGIDCNGSTVAQKVANGLPNDRNIHLNGRTLTFSDGGRVGIGTAIINCTVGNKLEITSGPNMPYWPVQVANGSSGLRFTFLNSTKTPIANGTNGVDNTKVLSVDANGDVVLVNGSPNTTANNGVSVSSTGAAQLGVPCTVGGFPNFTGILANQFTEDRVVPNRNYNFWFGSLNTETGGVGIGGQPNVNTFCNTGNTFEISANSKNLQYGSTSASGLRFTKLISTSPTIPNGTNGVDNTKVLTVDGDGDVVLVNSLATPFGNDCSSSVVNTFSNDWHVGLNGHSLNFDGTGNVNIGDIQGCVPGSASPARLWVRNTFGSPNPTTGFRVDNASIPGSYAAEFMGNVFIGGGGVSPGAGLIFSDKNLKINVVTVKNSLELLLKLRPVSYNMDNSNAPQLNVDVAKTYGLIAQEVAGVIPELVKNAVIPASYDSLGAIVNPSLTVSALNYTGLIPLTITAIQDLNTTQNGILATLSKVGLSDAQVKTNINPFNALAKIKTLSPVKYNFTNANVPQLNFAPQADYGFIAQQLENIYPELVDTVRIAAKLDSIGNVINPAKVLKTVNYKAMSALLVRSVQEQQFTIDSLRTITLKQDSINNAVQAQLAAIVAQMTACCANTNARSANSTINSLDIDLTDKDAIVLNQNVPNPFAEQTTITYHVPEKVGKAQILFFNAAGQIIQTVDVKTRGKGKINVFASDLSSGLYHYTLVADGIIIDSKKMVRE